MLTLFIAADVEDIGSYELK